jgi:predicted PurR-regulated permease PerM
MTDNHRDLISILFTLIIIVLTIFVAHNFFLPLAWAAIIAIVSWPLYQKIEKWLGNRKILASSLLTLIISCAVALPLFWMIIILIRETHHLINFLISANHHGAKSPLWLQRLPGVGNYLTNFWNDTLGKPEGISDFLSTASIGSLKPLNEFIKSFGLQIAHRSFIFGFVIISLFFFYKDGNRIRAQVNAIGHYCLNERWFLYAKTVPSTLKATVNGLVLVGIGVGILMGVSYAIVGMPAPALLGALTAILAMIPFGAPILFGIVALVLIAQGHLAIGIVLFAWGALIMFIADHFIRPSLIGGAMRLPFLAVLFGILGGMETMGLIGLFLGPAIMVLFITLWREPALIESPGSVAEPENTNISTKV